MTAWLFTFLVHSTLWCGIAWLCLRLFPGTRAHLRETIWYTALAASFVTPTAHTFTSPESAIWRLPLPSFVAGGEQPHSEGGRGEEEMAAFSAFAGEEDHGEETAIGPGWSGPVASLWLTLAVGLIVLHLVRLERMRRRLRDRVPVADPRAFQALAGLSRRAALDSPPRLTESHNLGSPVALGVGPRREICVPVRAFHELDEGELSALLGHEVAHHLRRDTIRLGMLNVLQAAFCFQPLVRLAAREVRIAAEEQCDDWAANQLEDRLAMASCLTEVAGWVARRDRTSPVPCIGRRRSQLELRVRRLMDEHRSLHEPSRVWWRVSCVGILALAPLFAPALAPERDAGHEDGRPFEHVQPQEHEQSGEREHGREHEQPRGRAHEESHARE